MLDLQPREFALLLVAQRQSSGVQDHDYRARVYDFDPLTHVVDALVSRLRNKVDRDFDKKLIHTYRGAGYALKVT